MNPNNPADPSAQTPKVASRQGSVKVALLCIIIIAVLAASLFLSMRRARELDAEVARAREEVIALKATTQSEANSENIAKALKALEELKKSSNQLGTNITRLEGRVDTLVSTSPPGFKNVIEVPPSEESKGGAQKKDPSKPADSDSKSADAKAKSVRMVFIRVGDAEVGQKGDNKSKDYYVPAGMDNLSRPICSKVIAKGLVAVSRKPGLRAKVLVPSDKKIGIIPDWRVWGLLGSGSKVLDMAVPTDAAYIQFDDLVKAKAKEVRFYWTTEAAEGNTDPLVIRIYKE